MEEVEEIVDYKWKKKKHPFPLKLKKLSVLSTIKSVTKGQLKRSRKVLHEFHEADELRRRISEAKNNLESYIYSTRGKLEESEIVKIVSTEEAREKLSTMLMDSEDWLYDQSDDSEDPFIDKLNELKDLSNPIFLRAYEHEMRPKTVEEAEKLLTYAREMLDSFEKEKPWIPEEETSKLLGKVDKLDDWIKNKTAAQANKTLVEEPAFFSEQVLSKLKPIAKLADELLRRPKPKEKPKKTKKNKKNTTTANTTTTGNSTTNDNTTASDANNTSEESKEKVETESSPQNDEKPSKDSEDSSDTSNPSSEKNSENLDKDSDHSDESEDSIHNEL